MPLQDKLVRVLFMNLLLIKRLKSWSSLSIPISRARASLRSLDAFGYCQPYHSTADKPFYDSLGVEETSEDVEELGLG